MSSIEKTPLEVAQMVEEAETRIRQYILHTPLTYTPRLSKDSGVEVYLKLENEQWTGSFKTRGAFNKSCVLKTRGVSKVYTASTGNHGMASALAFKTLGLDGIITIPVTADSEKREKLLDTGVSILQHGDDCVEAEAHARSLAESEQVPYLSPYNDYHVIAGQGTIGVELLKDLPDIDAVFVSVGGGGLIGGIAAYLKCKRPQCKIIGCSPRKSKVMHESVNRGKIIQEESYDTLSDGTAGGIEPGAVTFPLCRDLVDDWVLVEEEEIAEAIFYCLRAHKKVIEGAAGVPLAALKKVSGNFKGKRVAVVLCGANISTRNLRMVLNTHP
ncbi:L-threonine ammonia-lyase-like [Macrobrachium nipponense]|uniref:L-threonine ammonia-lyase-like n=1 Tax=Macrobrachium nipponense TaxID=159736 RepID=UPI0030C8B73F